MERSGESSEEESTTTPPKTFIRPIPLTPTPKKREPLPSISFEELKRDPETIDFSKVIDLDSVPPPPIPTIVAAAAATPQYYIAKGSDGSILVFRDQTIAFRIQSEQLNSQSLSRGERLIRLIAGAMGHRDASAILATGSEKIVDDLIELLKVVEVQNVVGASVRRRGRGGRKVPLQRFTPYVKEEEEEEEEETSPTERIPIKEKQMVDLLHLLSDNSKLIGVDGGASEGGGGGGGGGGRRQVTERTIFSLSRPFQQIVVNLVGRLLNADVEMIVTNSFYRVQDVVKKFGGPSRLNENDLLQDENRMIKFAELVSKMKNLTESDQGWRYGETKYKYDITMKEIEQLLLWFQNEFQPHAREIPLRFLTHPYTFGREMLQFGQPSLHQ